MEMKPASFFFGVYGELQSKGLGSVATNWKGITKIEVNSIRGRDI